jgi:hypothetical protein
MDSTQCRIPDRWGMAPSQSACAKGASLLTRGNFSLCGIIKVGLFGNKARLQPRPKQRGKQMVVFTSELETKLAIALGFFFRFCFLWPVRVHLGLPAVFKTNNLMALMEFPLVCAGAAQTVGALDM